MLADSYKKGRYGQSPVMTSGWCEILTGRFNARGLLSSQTGLQTRLDTSLLEENIMRERPWENYIVQSR